jgi:FeS assembly SUF system protein
MGFLSRFLGNDQPSREPATASAPPSVSAPDDDPSRPQGQWEFGALSAPPPTPAGDAPALVLDPAVTTELKPRIVEALKTVFDPEIPVDIYELGLIYDIEADAAHHVRVRMTLTSPACPSAQQLPSEVRYKVKAVEGVSDATVDVVWDPPWDKDRMSEVARLSLGLF